MVKGNIQNKKAGRYTEDCCIPVIWYIHLANSNEIQISWQFEVCNAEYNHVIGDDKHQWHNYNSQAVIIYRPCIVVHANFFSVKPTPSYSMYCFTKRLHTHIFVNNTKVHLCIWNTVILVHTTLNWSNISTKSVIFTISKYSSTIYTI